jgi:hypothetical protein
MKREKENEDSLIRLDSITDFKKNKGISPTGGYEIKKKGITTDFQCGFPGNSFGDIEIYQFDGDKKWKI